MSNKTCEICGQKKPLSEFSKSYKKRCKECVAEMQRSKRAEKRYQNYGLSPEEEVSRIDWEQRRYEIAKAMISVIYLDDGQAQRAEDNRTGIGFEYKVNEQMVKEAVSIADALIAKLKKGDEK